MTKSNGDACECTEIPNPSLSRINRWRVDEIIRTGRNRRVIPAGSSTRGMAHIIQQADYYARMLRQYCYTKRFLVMISTVLLSFLSCVFNISDMLYGFLLRILHPVALSKRWDCKENTLAVRS